MSNLVDLLEKTKPLSAQANTPGIDKTPIGTEVPFKDSKDLSADETALGKARNGVIGQYSGGYDNKKTYSSTVKL
jgi:hypothetical protein